MNPIALVFCGVVIVVGSILWLRLHAFLALVLGAYAVALLTPDDALARFAKSRAAKGELTEKAAAQFPAKPAGMRVAEEFGKTCASVGILIAMASIVGECLLASGAAEAIAAAMLRVTGAARAQLAFFTTAFFLTIPVFFETTFYLLIPLAKAMARKTRRDYLLYVMCIVAGGTITHSLVPPCPGPLYVAHELGVPLATMMGIGCVIGSGAALFGYVFAARANRRLTLEIPAEDARAADAAPHRALPPLALSLIPVVLPIALIALNSALSLEFAQSHAALASTIKIIGEKDMALTLGALAALALLAFRHGGESPRAAVQSALTSGAMIVLIISAGGAFGGALRQTGISETLGAMLAGAHLFVLPALFLITTLVRTAQGSATVAMITAAPIAKAFLESGAAHVHPVYFAIAIGCGSKPFPWMNDAGFWIITRLSGLREAQTLRTISPMMSLQGATGLVLTMAAAWVWPMR